MATRLGIALLGTDLRRRHIPDHRPVYVLGHQWGAGTDYTGTRAGGGNRGSVRGPAARGEMGAGRVFGSDLSGALRCRLFVRQATRLLSPTFFHGPMLSAMLRVELIAACVSCA